jgi:DNA-binding response OmpR family regulator
MNPGKRIRILSICDDDSIRFSRELVLKQEGYDVESVTSNAPLDTAKVSAFQIAILCHSLTAFRASQMADTLRRYNPSIQVVRIHAVRSQQDNFYDADCEVLPGPGAMLDGIRTLVTRLQTPAPSERRKQA